MLPSSGYFRSISCPFFENGLCERPHCHFKHVRKDVESNSTKLSSGVEFADNKPADLLRIVNEAVKKMQQEVDCGPEIDDIAVADISVADRKKTDKEEKKLNSGNKYLNCLNDDLKRKESTGEKTSNKNSMLEYKPTPISTLKKMQQENKYTTVMQQDVDELEYDPVSNFSAKVDKLKRSRIPYVPSKKKRSASDDLPDKVTKAKKVKKVVEDDESDFLSDDSVKSTKVNESVGDNKFDLIDQIITKSKMCEMAMTSTNKFPKKKKKVHQSSTPSSSKKVTKDSKTTTSSSKTSKSSKSSTKSSSKSPKSTKVSKTTTNDKLKSTKSSTKVSDSHKVLSSPKISKKSPQPKVVDIEPDVIEDEVEVEKINDEDSSHLFDLLDDSDVDEHDTYEECLRIFNEYVPTPTTNGDHKVAKTTHVVEESLIPGKKRVAHTGCNDNKTTLMRNAKAAEPRSARVTPAQTMFNRYERLKTISSKTPQQVIPTNSNSAFLSTVSSSASGKKRIAHVPNVSALMISNGPTTSVTNSSKPSSTKFSNSDSTVAHTVTKGVKRVAHNPKQVSNRPTITPEYGNKVPTNIRQRYLNLIIDECLKLYPEEEDAYSRGVAEEKSAYLRSTNRNVYVNVVVNAINRLRNETPGANPIIKMEELQIKKTLPKNVSHEFVLGGKKAANVSYSIERRRSSLTEDLTDKLMYESLQPYLLSKQQLEDNGFPASHPTDPGKAVIVKQNPKKKPINELERICCRCGAAYKVTSKGVYLNPEECIYHWGKAFKRRVAGALDNRYTCCSGDLESMGCCVNKVHVCDNVQYDNLKGFVRTLPKSILSDTEQGVFALDCEMSYTVHGCELTRITVIDSKLKTVYETLVKPENVIVDYNTKFSGITDEDMKNVTTTLRDVQAVLLSKFNNKTILIGHSLESDFLALKFIHETVVDTSVVFPHRLGLPYKRALRNLMAEYMNKIIQNNLDGHDSQEDAISCMQLMIWKVREDLKKKRF